MISFIGEWIKHIVLLILMATFLDLILPNSSMRKYVKLVVGFLLILLILSPILHLFRYDQERLFLKIDQMMQEDNKPLSLQLNREKEKLEELQEDAIFKEVSQKWSEEIKNSVENKFQLAVQHITLELETKEDGASIKELKLQVEEKTNSGAEEKKESTKDVSNSSQVREMDSVQTVEPVKSVEPVNIQISESSKKVEEDGKLSVQQKKIEEQVLAYLVDEWNISVDKIYFSWTRR
jgi:stage III sporulation protein AF